MRRNPVLTEEPHESEYLWWRENALLSGSTECHAEGETAAEENSGSQATLIQSS